MIENATILLLTSYFIGKFLSKYKVENSEEIKEAIQKDLISQKSSTSFLTNLKNTFMQIKQSNKLDKTISKNTPKTTEPIQLSPNNIQPKTHEKKLNNSFENPLSVRALPTEEQKPKQAEENPRAFSQLSLVDQIKLNKEYKGILKSAKKLLPSTQSYNLFKEDVDASYQNGNLEKVSYFISNFETLSLYQSNPNYADQLNNMVKDPLFSDFVEILSEISSTFDNTTENLQGTKEFKQSVSEELAQNSNNEQNLISTQVKEDLTPPPPPDFSKKFIRPELGKGTPEDRFVPILTNPSSVISEKTVDNINNLYQNTVSSTTTTQKDFDALNKFIETITNSPEHDAEEPFDTMGELGKSHTQDIIVDESLQESEEIKYTFDESEKATKEAQEEVLEEIRKQAEMQL